jgi:hypothetical protein
MNETKVKAIQEQRMQLPTAKGSFTRYMWSLAPFGFIVTGRNVLIERLRMNDVQTVLLG